jgi:hypothetical protein
MTSPYVKDKNLHIPDNFQPQFVSYGGYSSYILKFIDNEVHGLTDSWNDKKVRGKSFSTIEKLLEEISPITFKKVSSKQNSAEDYFYIIQDTKISQTKMSDLKKKHCSELELPEQKRTTVMSASEEKCTTKRKLSLRAQSKQSALTSIGPSEQSALTSIGPSKRRALTSIGPSKQSAVTSIGPSKQSAPTSIGPSEQSVLTSIGPSEEKEKKAKVVRQKTSKSRKQSEETKHTHHEHEQAQIAENIVVPHEQYPIRNRDSILEQTSSISDTSEPHSVFDSTEIIGQIYKPDIIFSKKVDDYDQLTSSYINKRWLEGINTSHNYTHWNPIASVYAILLYVQKILRWPLVESRIIVHYDKPAIRLCSVVEQIYKHCNIQHRLADSDPIIQMLIWCMMSMNTFGVIRPIIFKASTDNGGRLVDFCAYRHRQDCVLYYTTWPFRVDSQKVYVLHNQTKIKEIIMKSSILSDLHIEKNPKKVLKEIPEWVYHLCDKMQKTK